MIEYLLCTIIKKKLQIINVYIWDLVNTKKMSSSIVDTFTYLFVKLLRSMTDHLKIVVENRFHTDFHFILIIQFLFLNFN
jgi:hypothetical protein